MKPPSITGATLGPIFTGDGQVELSGNVAIGKNSTWCDSYWSAETSEDQEWFTTASALTTSRFIEIYGRTQNPGTTSKLNAYIMAVASSGGAWTLYRVKAGVKRRWDRHEDGRNW